MRRTTILIVAFVLLAVSSLTANAFAGKIYWSDEVTGTIQRANLDGSGVEEVIGIEDAEDPGALAIDEAGRKIYWASFATPPFIPKVRRADLNGTNAEDIVIVGGKARPGGVALDLINDHVLSTDPSDCDGCGFIDRAGLDGSDPEHLIPNRNFPNAIAVDPASAFIWWSESALGDLDGIYRANLDGSGLQLIVDGPEVRGIAVDPGGAKIYWTDEDAGGIRRSNLDGTGIEELVDGLDAPHGIALDLSVGKMYWANRNGGMIQRADLDGTNVEDILLGLPRPTGVALDLIVDEPVPALSPPGMFIALLLLLVLGGVAARRANQ